jgi:aminopeptidase N
LAFFVVLGCHKKVNPTPQLASGKSFVIPSDSVINLFKSKPVPTWAPKKNGYKPSSTRFWDLIHTKLEVKFDWKKQHLIGKAVLTLEPYFYPQNELILDAKGFEINSVVVLNNARILDSKYAYSGNKLRIFDFGLLGKGQQIKVEISYVAKPNELPEGGSLAITKDKGLYFINPLGADSTIPRQIWTQGETEAASCWFPTFDTPNEKCTQEIAITIEKNFKTLSNGVMVSSKEEANGFRTDFWEMKLPHAPYLFMMAIGEYAVVKDKWGKVPVNYWVEPKFEKYARKIFGNTPKMMEFFSNKLGYKFPWPKYDQVVVRDFVSGAMENTSASTFMEALQSTDRELVDKNWDDIIAHELFHQWFGDLVTIESWANLPLNESFANYSQYLWDEYKYGKDEADYQALRERQLYFYEASRKREPLIRYQHNKPDDMFDSHSYAKGGRILHMLRKEVGDEAFFQSLQLYLKENEFENSEINHLRLAFEKVTGRDLNWFFNQWFLSAGHPELVIKSQVEGDFVKLYVQQVQDTNYAPLYRIPLKFEVWTESGCETISAELKSISDTIVFKTNGLPETIIWDAEACVLANVKFDQSLKGWMAQYKYASQGIHRYEALQKLKSEFGDFPHTLSTMKLALSDPFWVNRQLALEFILEQDLLIQKTILEMVIKMAPSDPKPQVRALAFKILNQNSFDRKKAILEIGIKDSSIVVSQAAYKAYIKEGYPDLAEKISSIPKEEQKTYGNIVADFYASKKGEESFLWFKKSMTDVSFSDPYELIQSFGRFMQISDSATTNEGLNFVYKLSMERKKAEIVIATYQILKNFQNWPDIKNKRKKIKEVNKNEDFGEVLDYLE